MLTHVMSPTLSQWFSVIGVKNVDESTLLREWHSPDSASGLLSRSTWSIGLISNWRRRLTKKEVVTIFVPDFFCDSALGVAKACGHEIVLYSISEDGHANFGELRKQCNLRRPDLLIMPHYFGTANSQASLFAELAKNEGAWLVEDCAHSVAPYHSIGAFGDFVLFSPHKLLPIPIGAILSVRSLGPSKLDLLQFGDANSWSSQIRETVNFDNLKLRSAKMYQYEWLIKRLIQRLGIARKPRIDETISNQLIGKQFTIMAPEVPQLTRRMLASLVDEPKSNFFQRFLLPGVPAIGYLDRSSAVRQSNSTLWDEVIAVLGKGTVVPVSTEHLTTIPYLVAYRGNVGSIFASLRKLGVPVSTWPDLPQDVYSEPDSHRGALQLRDQRIYLPIHPNINAKDIHRLLKAINKNCQISPEPVEMNDVVSIVNWNKHISNIESANLLQSWEYGEAKSRSEGWTSRRLVYSVDKKTVAISQILERRIFGILLVARLSRGPMYLIGTSDSIKSAVLRKTTSRYSLSRLRFLSISPEILVGSSLQPVSGLMTLRRVSPIGTESALLDLSHEVEVLRLQLDHKWRNQLVVSERSGAQVSYSTEVANFEWFENVYEALRKEKGFYGIPSNLFQDIWKSFHGTGSAHLFICNYQDEKAAAVLIVSHGNSATYLAGWNGPDGRKIHANNLLLWQAVCQLKELGIKYLDLGGIDLKNTPTIASFKLGMHADNYRTIGEFVKLL